MGMGHKVYTYKIRIKDNMLQLIGKVEDDYCKHLDIMGTGNIFKS